MELGKVCCYINWGEKGKEMVKYGATPLVQVPTRWKASCSYVVSLMGNKDILPMHAWRRVNLVELEEE